MKWQKQGLIYQPNKRYAWNQSHAQVPVVEQISDKLLRIYYATRNEQNISRISFIEVEADNPSNIVYEADEPILDLGKIGTFDDCGQMPTCVINFNHKIYLYYIGWTRRVTVPYHNAIGLAISDDNGKTFYKYSEGPVFDVNYKEPYFTGTAFVLPEDKILRAWYLSCTKWEMINGKTEPFYHIKYAESQDGVNWQRDGLVAIDYKDKIEGGIASASVVKEDNKYRMWYSYRSAVDYRTDKKASYKIGYAESFNALDWERKDELAGIEMSREGWDSEMIAYPYVIRMNNNNYMFYNGNGFGRTGFGYAILSNSGNA